MKGRQTLNRFLIAIFIIIIGSPICFTILSSQTEISYYENRAKSSFPGIHLSRLENKNFKGKLVAWYLETRKFIISFDAYFSENFGLRDLYLSLYSHYKFYFLNVSPYPEDVVLGSDGWMFVGNRFSQCLLETSGLERFESRELDSITSHILSIKDWAVENNIAFYLAVAPEKQTVYPECIPLLKAREMTKREQVKTALKKEGFQIIDLKEGLSEHMDRQLYNKTDSHWNDLGAFHATNNLLGAVKKDSLRLEDYEVDTLVRYNKDLSRLIAVPLKEEEVHLIYNRSDNIKKGFKKLKIPKEYQLNPDVYEQRFENPDGSGKIVYFHDSFAQAMMQFISTRYKESVFIWQYKIEKDILLKEKPDVIVLQVVERNLEILLSL